MSDSPQKQQLEGTADKAEGRAQEAYGALTNDTSDKLEGKWKQVKGEIKQEIGEARED